MCSRAVAGRRRRKIVKLRKGAALLAPAVVVAMIAAACGGSNDSGGGGGGGGGGEAKGGTLVYGFETKFPANLLPAIAAGNSVATAYLEIRVLPGAFRNTPDFKVVPDNELVTSAPTSETKGGKQVVTYKLNPQAVWSDGTPISAKDFKYSWQAQRSSDPKDGGCADLISTTGYEQIATVEGSDNDKTVTVTYDKPFSDWQSIFAAGSPLLPAHIMDKGDPKANCDAIRAGWPTANGIPVSGGPWQLTKESVNVAQKTMTLTPNPKYWGAKPKLDRLVYLSVGNDPGVSVKAMKSGEVGMIYPQPQLDLVRDLRGLAPKVTTKISFGLSFEHLDMNTRNFHLKDPVVRKAIATALDRPKLVQATVAQFDNRAQVLNNRFYVNNQPEYKDNSGGAYDKGDVAKAKSMLEGDGYKLGADGYYAKDGKRLELELMTTQNNPLRENTIDVITAQLKPAGIKINKFLNPDIFEDKSKPRSLEGGKFDMALFAWVSSIFVSGNVSIYRSVKGAAQGQNYVWGNDPKVDTMLDQLTTETDLSKQAETANAADTQLWQDMFTLPLYQKPTLLAYDSNFVNINENSTSSGPLWNSEVFARKA
jgi:peptide/nickel transport system substrate-binding protein